MNHHIADLLSHPKVQATRHEVHHYIPKYDHLLRSARYAHRIAPLLRADRRTCVRAALLHDIDSRLGTLATHGAIAARFAAGIGEPEDVCRAITSHMYPIGPAPTSREGWVLMLADKAASLRDTTQFMGTLLRRRSVWARGSQRRGLRKAGR